MQPATPMWRREWPRVRAYCAAAVLVAVAIAAGSILRRLPQANLSLLFLLAVLTVSAVWGLWPSIFATMLSFLAINFFFTPPLYTFTVEEEGDLASIVFFVAMAALTANLASRMRNEMAESRSALERVSTLLDFSSKMSSAVSVEDALNHLTTTIARTLGRQMAVWLPGEDGHPKLVSASASATTDLDTGRLTELLQTESGSALTLHGAPLLEFELTESDSGIVAIGGGPLTAEEKKFADGLCEQAGLAVERILLVEDLKTAHLAAQTEQLRSALLSSVSHDLRTPLASIIGSVSSVLEYRDILKPEDQHDLLQTVLEESQRLNRYIQNLLDMTRFGQQRIEVKREWVDLNDLAFAAVERFGRMAQQFAIDVQIAPEVALIQVQGALVEQALVNILDNAFDFSKPGDSVRIEASLEDDATVVDIIDEGPGIPEADRERVFEMFYTVGRPDDRRHGAGLGLAIARSIVEAHGGMVDALPGPGERGTRMRVRLPVSENPIGDADA